MSKQELLEDPSDQEKLKSQTHELEQDAETRGDQPGDQQLDELITELQERDQLIEMLTERLEEAAQQLDRVHRTGIDKALPGTSAANLPDPLLEHQSRLADRLETAIDRWEEGDAKQLLERIDLRVDHLLELIQSNSEALLASAPEENGLPEELQQQARSNGMDSWENIKSRLFEDSDQHETDDTPEAQSTAQKDESPLVRDLSTDPPEAVDPDEQDMERLHEAIIARDEYICALLAEFRRHQRRDAIDWSVVSEGPEALRQSIEELQCRLEQDLQREELSLSLERAKVARERAKLQSLKTQFEKEIYQLEMGPNEDAERKKTAKSWLKRLADLTMAKES